MENWWELCPEMWPKTSQKESNVSILETLQIGLVYVFCLDCMHCVCIGVMKRLMNRWKKSKLSENKCYISANPSMLLDRHLDGIATFIPSEFARKMTGGVKTIAFWEATEYRLFLLYAGVIVLLTRNFLPRFLYKY